VRRWPDQHVFTSGVYYVCANFDDRESALRRTDRRTDANRFYNLSHALCYSYGAENTESRRACAVS